MRTAPPAAMPALAGGWSWRADAVAWRRVWGRPPRDHPVFVRTTSDLAVAVGHSVDPARWRALLDEAMSAHRRPVRAGRAAAHRTGGGLGVAVIGGAQELLVVGRACWSPRSAGGAAAAADRGVGCRGDA